MGSFNTRTALEKDSQPKRPSMKVPDTKFFCYFSYKY